MGVFSSFLSVVQENVAISAPALKAGLGEAVEAGSRGQRKGLLPQEAHWPRGHLALQV